MAHMSGITVPAQLDTLMNSIAFHGVTETIANQLESVVPSAGAVGSETY